MVFPSTWNELAMVDTLSSSLTLYSMTGVSLERSLLRISLMDISNCSEYTPYWICILGEINRFVFNAGRIRTLEVLQHFLNCALTGICADDLAVYIQRVGFPIRSVDISAI